MYKVEFSKNSAKQLQKIFKLDQKLYSRLLNAIESLSLDPFQGKVLKADLQGSYSLRVGTYRIIYSLEHQKLVVYIIDLGHRRDIYN